MYICTRKPSIFCNMFRLEATWMWQYGHDTIPDWDGKLLIINTDPHNSLVETNALPGTIAAYGYTIVLQGWMTMLFNGREVHFTKDDLIIYTPGMMVSVIDISDDIRGICLVADKDFAFESTTIRDAIRAAYLPAVELREPRLTLAEEDNYHLMELMGIIRRYLLSADHPFRSECLRTTYGLSRSAPSATAGFPSASRNCSSISFVLYPSTSPSITTSPSMPHSSASRRAISHRLSERSQAAPSSIISTRCFSWRPPTYCSRPHSRSSRSPTVCTSQRQPHSPVSSQGIKA